ncbi:MAG: type II toxin-antitoxin system VapC family toxin [Pseudanabaena sp. M135S2SP2A07QC]|nr:type II toxin-antitoxin system VapC family toxin [Pseudanabaena sp. M090S1SP2A07QC]MCA6506178.1 type II toxin-antitoxin system VapC family toxin [Pseudanabaena sp. M172S2SP2A07QC]MCA6521203.1 type II toxin-antitoxin system VapC family toxin [Pseudanabaena sp. M051S1SP2A07QC]MCA6528330.1 type II toxin-antitoxin system VapC family toxin [Pseudanabaena sp. M179S2SP2A07QC]MCA6529181.1 type II toxin-antitoxin system VapC family toxin [Pseudanabaena sp. M125S2SP2A07QC]MCA6533258.1 type II toxin-a
MRVLIDTHVFIWWTSDVKKLSSRVHDLLLDPSTEAILSMVSIWEMQIKLSLGKLQFRTALSELVDNEINRNRIELLSLSLSHIYALSNLPHHHRDPFDRILIAQSMDEDLQILSIDEKFDAYGVKHLW